MVDPSGTDRATRSLASVLPPPTTFSMIMVWPSVRDICSPIRRATVSVPPPAANGTTNVTVFGLGCAWAGIESADIKRPKPVRALLQSRLTTIAPSELILLLLYIRAKLAERVDLGSNLLHLIQRIW